ncbi:CehA/McbA family metallohydrolase [Paenibacillus sp. YYML68]|uniref:CehA/McbA family metallohydrolase n=1 Tax=Paenibacillus sp. YYML68 TaxID=2909250 RepID=UPI002493081D|nr:CehA/McbA family metallohydrolase [Paenibacillus sp. YYML68]
MNWIPFELHTHTPHSDGRHTLLEMCLEAKKLGLEGIALTDHNTVSGLAEAKRIQDETGIAIIQGLEWTTFYGHMLTLGAPYCEWRDLGIHDIHVGIERVHRAGGIVGIAHPYTMGSPICTGCHWEYEVKDWEDIDYIEVWHGMTPSYTSYNQLALQQWTSLLNEGYRITATAGRDWHHSDSVVGIPAFTYIGLEERVDRYCTGQVVQAIQRGRCFMSIGPLLHVEAQVDNRTYMLGDCIDMTGVEAKVNTLSLSIQLQFSEIPSRNSEHMQVTRIIAESNRGDVLNVPWMEGQTVHEPDIPIEGLRWLRIKAVGVLYGGLTTVALTNPIYFTSKVKFYKEL